jgi:hypothetical protein
VKQETAEGIKTISKPPAPSRNPFAQKARSFNSPSRKRPSVFECLRQDMKESPSPFSKQSKKVKKGTNVKAGVTQKTLFGQQTKLKL